MRPLWEGQRDRRLVEPLCGGLAITLGLMPEKALLNDVNQHAINFYAWLKRGLRISLPMANDASVYYAHREGFNRLIKSGESDSVEAASLFYYLNRTGYNGLCRFNSKGLFNVPFGKHKRINYTTDFLSYAHVFSAWEFSTGDFQTVPLEATDFVYADPPYDVEFTQYSQERFGWPEQIRLAEWLAKHPGPVVLSNQATERIVALYESLGFRLTYLDAPRLISCNGDRTPAREVLAIRGM